MHASTQNVDFPCICFHAHRGPRFHASHCPSINSLPRPSRSSHTRPSRSLHKLALMPIASRPIHTPRFHAHRSPPTQSLPRHLRHYHTLAASLAFTLIAVLPYTRFQTLPLNTLEFTRIRVAALPYTSFFLPSRSSHTLASKPTALEYPRFHRFHAHCCPPVNSFHFSSRPGGAAAAPQTLDSLHFLICTRSVHAQARLSACARLKQRDHAVVPAGRRGGESDEEDGAARGSRNVSMVLQLARP